MAEAAPRLVLIALDTSPRAEQAFAFYVKKARKPDDKVILVHVPEMPHFSAANFLEEMVKLPVGYLGQPLTSIPHKEEDTHHHEDEWTRLKEREMLEMEELQAKYDKLKEEHQVAAELRVLYGKPGEAIVAAAQEMQASYIVLGSRGRGTIRRTIMGSVSGYVLHHAHCPVLICRH